MANYRIPVTIMTGFLGSGKTTVLSRWLRTEAFARAVVIVNEFGKAGLDHTVLRAVSDKTLLLNGGCACCNLKDDLVREMKGLAAERDAGDTDFNRVVIETTGLADPAPILFSILTDPMLKLRYSVDRCVVCVDAVNAATQLSQAKECEKQIAAADCILLTKTDLADRETVLALKSRLLALNPAAAVFTANMGEVDQAAVFRADGLAAERETARRGLVTRAVGDAGHTSPLRSLTIGFDGKINWSALGFWLTSLLYAHGEDIYRMKGVVNTDNDLIILNGVQHIMYPPEHLRQADGTADSTLVFILKKLDPQAIVRSLCAYERMLGTETRIRELS